MVYSLASALPLLIFGFLGPIIRRKAPNGFVLTEWVRQRYGLVAAWYLSALTYVGPNPQPRQPWPSLMEAFQTHHNLPLHGRRAVRFAADRRRFDRP